MHLTQTRFSGLYFWVKLMDIMHDISQYIHCVPKNM